MRTVEHFNTIRSEEKRRYIANNVVPILCALIGRRASTNPLELVESAVETTALLYETLTPVYTPPNGVSDSEVSTTNGHIPVT